MTAPCDGGSGRGPKPGAKPRSAPASTPAPGGHGAPVSCDPAAGGGQPAADLPWHRLQQPWHGAHPARHAHHPALRLHHGAAHAPPAGFFIDLQSWCQFVFEALWGSAASIICSGQTLLHSSSKNQDPVWKNKNADLSFLNTKKQLWVRAKRISKSGPFRHVQG